MVTLITTLDLIHDEVYTLYFHQMSIFAVLTKKTTILALPKSSFHGNVNFRHLYDDIVFTPQLHLMKNHKLSNIIYINK